MEWKGKTSKARIFSKKERENWSDRTNKQKKLFPKIWLRDLLGFPKLINLIWDGSALFLLLRSISNIIKYWQGLDDRRRNCEIGLDSSSSGEPEKRRGYRNRLGSGVCSGVRTCTQDFSNTNLILIINRIKKLIILKYIF